MRVTLFFVSLCFLLLKGFSYSYAGVQQNGLSSPTAHTIHKAFALKFTSTVQDSDLFIHADTDKEGEYLVADTVEDEDTNNLFARKYRLPASCYLTFSCLFFLSYLRSRFKGPWSFFSLISCKYIQQRALRI